MMNLANNKLSLDLSLLNQLNRYQATMSLASMGVNGHVFVTNSAYSTSTFNVLVAWGGADAQVDYTLTRLDGTTVTHSNVAIKDGGMPIFGVITGLNVDSGTVCAYYAIDYR